MPDITHDFVLVEGDGGLGEVVRGGAPRPVHEELFCFLGAKLFYEPIVYSVTQLLI